MRIAALPAALVSNEAARSALTATTEYDPKSVRSRLKDGRS